MKLGPLALTRLVRPRGLIALGAAFLALMGAPVRAASAGTVYMVLGSDTAVWNAPGGIAVAQYRNHFDPTLFTSPATNAYQSIDPAFRSQFVDSFGQPLKMTWWLLVGSVYGQSDNFDVPVPNLMPLYLMLKYHGDTLRALGDEVTLHYHTFLWSDYNGDGVYYWNQALSFHECRADWELALAQSLIEEEVFPVSFRSGWHYMDNEWQQTLNELLPYSMDDDAPSHGIYRGAEPIYNVIDWSQASTQFIPFHPASTNYQVAGDGAGWNVHSVKFVNVTQAMVNKIFEEAANGTDQVVSFWGHMAESDFVPQIAKVDSFTQAAAASHPGVLFRYCTAVEAMQRWRHLADRIPPDLTITQTIIGNAVTLKIASSETLFQPAPFVAVKDIFQRYSIAACLPDGSNAWTAAIGPPVSEIARIGIAATDLAGNLSTRILRFLPDELYLDNLDPEYRELSGAWTNSAAAAWGVDSRVALLHSNETASVRWTLPVTAAASYHLLTQFPALTNAATNLLFTLEAGGTNLFTRELHEIVRPNRWIYLGEAFLDPAQSNTLEMTVTGNDAAESAAAADVIKLSPLALQTPDALTEVVVDASDTTATVLWRTAEPSSGWVYYGLDDSFGQFSTTNSRPALRHAITLTGLAPGANYHFQINSSTPELWLAHEGVFQTEGSAPPLKVNLLVDRGLVTLYWNGVGCTLQHADRLGGPPADWVNVSGLVASPYPLPANAAGFYRLQR